MSATSAPSHNWTEEEEFALVRLDAEPVSLKERALSNLKEQH